MVITNDIMYVISGVIVNTLTTHYIGSTANNIISNICVSKCNKNEINENM